jgi:hypothetical protein
MKKIFCCLMLLTAFGCVSESGLEMQTREYTGEICDSCPVVRVSVPEAINQRGLGRTVNTAIREEILELMDYDEAHEAVDIPGAIAAFQQGFQKMQREFPEELTGWEASVEGVKSYEDKDMLCIRLDTYIFTGGAHGYASTRYLNFDKGRGKELDAEELFSKPDGFASYAEAAFRKQHKIEPDAPINSTGFMFEDNRFILPENIGLAAEGLILHYNPYEAASYADGALILEFPFSEIRDYLVWAE